MNLLLHPQLHEDVLDTLDVRDQLPLRLVSSAICDAVTGFGEQVCVEWMRSQQGLPAIDAAMQQQAPQPPRPLYRTYHASWLLRN